MTTMRTEQLKVQKPRKISANQYRYLQIQYHHVIIKCAGSTFSGFTLCLNIVKVSTK